MQYLLALHRYFSEEIEEFQLQPKRCSSNNRVRRKPMETYTSMESDKFFNILEEFDFNLLDDPEFKEDSVREEIVSPIIKGLGYSAAKPNQIIRSRKLLHPFVSIGSQRKEIFIIPDYLMEVDGKPAWTLDAKAPSENIVKSAHVEQAYSYAIHSEVRAKYFAFV